MSDAGTETEYQVFARINQGDPLEHLGSVNAPNDRLAKSFAQSIYDEEEWVRMIVVDEADIVEVPTENNSSAPTLLMGDQ